MKTIKEYLSGKVTHSEYYQELAEACGISMGNSSLLAKCKKALADGDEVLNTIPLHYWDYLAMFGWKFNREAIDQAFKERGDYWSLNGGVCMLKEIAKKAVKDSQ